MFTNTRIKILKELLKRQKKLTKEYRDLNTEYKELNDDCLGLIKKQKKNIDKCLETIEDYKEVIEYNKKKKKKLFDEETDNQTKG